MPYNGHVYGVVWRFEARTCQTVTKFIRCNSLEISTIRQMHYTRCYRLVFFVFRHFSFNLLLLSCLPCVGVGKLFGWFWSCGWLFERPANVLDYEAWANLHLLPPFLPIPILLPHLQFLHL